MKLLKIECDITTIILIIALLVLLCIPLVSLGRGTITSGDKTVDMADIKEMYEDKEEKSILNDWFKNLPVTEKMKLHTYWHGLNHYRSEFDDRLMWVEERVKKLEDDMFKILNK